MTRLTTYFLAILFITGQAFAQVTVYVDVKQTGPTSVGGEVQARVGKNVDSTYSAEARYNGQPTLNHEETIQNTKWTYTVSADNKVTYNPKSGNSNTATITAKSAEVGTYEITATFKVTFTIKKPNSPTREESYTGSGSATLNVKQGKFEVKIKPIVLIPQYSGDTDGYRNKLGIGESATINVFPESGSSDTVEFYTATSTDFLISGASFEAGSVAAQGTISVYACINGAAEPDGPETIGVTVVEPMSAVFTKLAKLPHPSPPGAGKPYDPYVGMLTQAYFLPNDVSFSQVQIQEGTAPALMGGYWTKKYPNGYEHPEGEWFQISHNAAGPMYNKDSVTDTVSSGPHQQPPAFEDGSYFQWNIPWFYRVVGHAKDPDKFFILIHRATMEKDRSMRISKGGATESTPPY